MRSFLIVFLLIVIGGAGAAWKFYGDEIRAVLGLPAAGEEEYYESEPETASERRRSSEESDESASQREKPQPVGSVSDKESERETRIGQIVMARYPDVEMAPFESAFPNIADAPKSVYPSEVTLKREVQFKHVLDGSMVAASLVKKGGRVAPEQIDGDQLIVKSLARNEMSLRVPLSETDFEAALRSRRNGAYARARERLQKMRDADRLDLRANLNVFDQLEKPGSEVWRDPEDRGFSQYAKSLHKLLGDRFNPIGYFKNGRQLIDEPEMSGYGEVTIVLLEGMDSGFGPFLWRVRGMYLDGRLLWKDLPPAN